MSETFKPATHGIDAIDLELRLGNRDVLRVSTFVYPEVWEEPYYLQLHIEKLIYQTIAALRTKGYIPNG